MLAEHTDIRFSCTHCGQRMVIEISGAGHEMNCPYCDTILKVPLINEVELDLGSNRHNRPAMHVASSSAGEDIFASANQAPVTELDSTRKEIGRLQAQYRKVLDDRERLTASLTHSQAENKSFHGDRQQLKAELSQIRQRAVSAEGQVAEWAATFGNLQSEKEQLEHDLGLIRDRLSATETQLGVRNRDLNDSRGENSELMQGLATAQAELAAALAESRRIDEELQTAHSLLSEAEQVHLRTEDTARQWEAQFADSQTENQRLRNEREQWRQEAEGLRGDLKSTDQGQELLTLRERGRELLAQVDLLESSLSGRVDEVKRLTASGESLSQTLDGMKSALVDAERRAAEGAESKLQKDNEVLRGIIARQNTNLSVHHAEIRRLRRGRFWQRSVYALFALGLIGLCFFAIQVFAGGIEALVPKIQAASNWIGSLINR